MFLVPGAWPFTAQVFWPELRRALLERREGAATAVRRYLAVGDRRRMHCAESREMALERHAVQGKQACCGPQLEGYEAQDARKQQARDVRDG